MKLKIFGFELKSFLKKQKYILYDIDVSSARVLGSAHGDELSGTHSKSVER